MLNLRWLPYELDVCRFSKETSVPSQLYQSQWFNVCRTESELSVVCCSSIGLQAPKVEHGWVMFKIEGTLDFALTGILAKLTSVLAKEGISLFACSTFDTDYVLIKGGEQALAHQVLASAGYAWSNQPEKLVASFT